MSGSILEYLPFDPAYLLFGMLIIIAILIVLVVVLMGRSKKLYYRYDEFMRGRDAESLEQQIYSCLDRTQKLMDEDVANKALLKSANRMNQQAFQKMGLVKYNAFPGMGGKISFCLAMLNSENTGFIINVLHSREGCYVYLKDVTEGQTEAELGKEEAEALVAAVKSK